MDKLVSVIIINYNGAEFIEECLLSVYNQSYENVEVIVLDNNSTDNSIEILESHKQKIKLITSDVNLGFAKGNNFAIEASHGEYIALLNNDAIADKDWLMFLVEEMNSNNSLGSCACKIISYYDRTLMDSAGLLITIDGLSRGNGRQELINLFNDKKEILIPSGCAAIYSRKALNQVGLFDEDFFCYCEDTDLGLRLQLYGWKCIYIPSALVYHRYSEAAGKFSAFKAYLVERNHYWLIIKNYPISLLLLNPLYTFKRYLYQLADLIKGQGTTSEFMTATGNKKIIIMTLFRAHFDTWKQIRKFIKKRRIIQKNKVVSRQEFMSWINEYGISYNKLFSENTTYAQSSRIQKSIDY